MRVRARPLGPPGGGPPPALGAWGCLFPLLPFAWVVAEVAAIVEVGQRTGALPAALLVIGGSLLGITVLRSGGLKLAAHLLLWGRRVAEGGAVEALPVAASVPRLLAGLLLLAPGLVTDALALLCVLPPFRGLLIRKVDALFEAQRRATEEAAARARGFGGGGVIIEGVVVTRGPSAGAAWPPLRLDGAPEGGGGGGEVGEGAREGGEAAGAGGEGAP